MASFLKRILRVFTNNVIRLFLTFGVRRNAALQIKISAFLSGAHVRNTYGVFHHLCLSSVHHDCANFPFLIQLITPRLSKKIAIRFRPNPFYLIESQYLCAPYTMYNNLGTT
jgi:hypothetical protein